MARKTPAEAFLKVSLTNGSTIILKDARTAVEIARQLEKRGFVKTTAVQEAHDKGVELVVMKAAVLMLAAHAFSLIETGIVRVTSVPSKTRN
jgi:hypothetical protein